MIVLAFLAIIMGACSIVGIIYLFKEIRYWNYKSLTEIIKDISNMIMCFIALTVSLLFSYAFCFIPK